MDEVCYINDYVQDKAGNNADIIWGNTIDNSLGEALSVTIIATGFEDDSLSDFLPKEITIEKFKIDTADKKENIEQGPKPIITTAGKEFKTEFPVNNKEKIEHLELDREISSVEQEIRQSELNFDFANQAQPFGTNAQPLRYSTEQELLELENQPAYLRQQQSVGTNQNPVQAQNISRQTMNRDGSLGENRFLYDNVD